MSRRGRGRREVLAWLEAVVSVVVAVAILAGLVWLIPHIYVP